MKIPFQKLSSSPTPFEITKGNLNFSGTLVQKNRITAECLGEIKGSYLHRCDRCGDDIDLDLNLDINLLLSDGILKDENHELSNAMEFFDSNVDLEEILQSETELYLSDYFYCNKCKDK